MRAISLLLAAILALPLSASAQKARVQGQALKWIFTLVTGAAAAKAAGNADQAHAVFVQKDAIATKLKSQGLDTTDGAIYSLYFTLNGDVSSVMWADIFSKPDIFVVVQIEGDGTYIIPDIHNEYAGQPIIENLFRKAIPAGRKILVHILDDDSVSDDIWNNILQTSGGDCVRIQQIEEERSWPPSIFERRCR